MEGMAAFTVRELLLMGQLAKAGRGMTCSELRPMLETSLSGITSICLSLERRGLVMRSKSDHPKSADRRCVHVHLTEAGAKLINDKLV